MAATARAAAATHPDCRAAGLKSIIGQHSLVLEHQAMLGSLVETCKLIAVDLLAPAPDRVGLQAMLQHPQCGGTSVA